MDFEPTEDLDLYRPRPAWVVPAVATCAMIGTSGLSVLIGFFVGSWQTPPTDMAVEVVSTDDIAFARVCAPVKAEAQTEIQGLSEKISSLSEDIEARKQRVAELEQTMATRADAGRRLVRELESTREALAVAIQHKEILETEKQRLISDLTRTRTVLAQTEEALDDQIEVTEEVHEDWIDQHYERFVNAAQLEICEKGNRKKLGECRQTVTLLLRRPTVSLNFAHCLRSGQEAPTVYQHEGDVPLPVFASYLDQQDKVVRDWAVQACDPTLPEAPSLLARSVIELDLL